LAFNEFGDLFTVDNNSDSGDKARLVHIVEGMDAGWRMSFQYLADRGPFNREKIWYTQNEEQPAFIVPPVAHIADGPSGLAYYPGTGLPHAYDGAFFLVDFRGAPATSGIREFHVEQQGPTYQLKSYKTFVSGVLASDCDFGPSGDFYILDWVEGWNGPGVGRIHRVSSDDVNAVKERKDTQTACQKISKATINELIEYLSHPNMRVRRAAQQQLVEKGAESIPALESLAANSDATLFGRLHAIWALGVLAEGEPQLFDHIIKLCDDKNAEIRTQAARTMERAAKADDARRSIYGKSMLKLLNDTSPRVRCFAAISLGKLQYANSLFELVKLANKDGNDPTLRHAIAAGLAASQPSERLVQAAKEASDLQRLVLVVALGKQKSPLVAQFLNDKDDRVVLEAARVIWNGPIPAAYPKLAAIIDKVPSSSDPLARRVLAANVAGRSLENLQAIITFASRPDVSTALRDLAWEQVRTFAAPSSRDSVYGDWRPLDPRPAADVAAAMRSSLPKLVEISATNPGGLIVAAELGVDEAFEQLYTVVSNDAQPEDVRVRALAAFRKANDDAVHKAIDAGVKSPAAAVRSAARKLWADRFPTQVVERLSDTINSGTIEERQAAIDTLAGIKNSAAIDALRDWMGRLENGTCPPELEVEVLDAAAKSTDPALVARQKQFVDKLARKGRVSQYSDCLSGGDAARGRKLFETNDIFACRRCHSIRPNEVLVGPCLANVGAQRKPEDILESIVTPNAKICEGFETAVLQLDSGKIVTGIIRRETDSKIEIVDADAKTIVVDPTTVENRVKGKSPMPENLMDQMTPRQLRDLIAFLGQLKTSDSPAATK
jgi:quinoprotein glucose dehydrogenase